MAVSPFRALFAAHLQAGLNRSAKELGKGGVIALLLVAGLSLLLVLLPGLGSAGALGYALGRALAKPQVEPILALLFLVVPLGAGILGGLSGSTQALTWDSYRTFPLPFRTLFLAELLAGFGDLLPLLLGLAFASFLAGLAWAAPGTLLAVPLVWLVGMLVQLSVQHLMGGLAALLVKRLQVGLILLGVAVWMALALAPAVSQVPGRSRGDRAAHAQAQRAAFDRMSEGLVRLEPVLAWTPQGQMARGLVEAARGRWGRGLIRQAAGVAFALVLVWGAARVLRWETEPQRLQATAPGRAKPLWSFRSPLAGLARLAWETVVGSHLGRFGFLMPLFTLVLIKGPFARGGEVSPWAVPMAFAYLSLTGSQMLSNQFGLYGPGVKALLLLPVRPRTLLLGQALGLGAYLALQGALTVALLKALTPATGTELVAGVGLGACFFFVQASVGHFTSAAMPRTMPRDSLKSGGLPVLLVLINLALTLVGGVVFGGLYAGVRWLAPAWLVPVMLGLAAACGGVYALLLPLAGDFLEGRRDTIVEALG